MTNDEFDYMSISHEMKKADKDRLKSIGIMLSKDDTVSEDVKSQLRGLYARLMEHHDHPKRRKK